MPHTSASAYVNLINNEGAMRHYTTAKPTATMFRHRSVQHPVFAQGWYHENMDKGASAYLGESLTYTASRNKDVHCDTLVQFDLPGIGNAQYIDSFAGNQDRWLEVLHPDLQHRYEQVAATQSGSGFTTHSISENLCRLNAGSSANGAIRKESGQPFWCDGVALAAIKSIEYSLGGQRMDRHDKHALYTWHLLNNVNVPYKMLGLAESRDNNDLELKRDSMAFQRKYCPAVFTFCRHPSMAIPLISNIYNNLVINMELEPFTALIRNYSGAGNSAGSSVNSVTTHTDLDASTAVLAPPPHTAALGHTKADVAAAMEALPKTTQFYTFAREKETTLAASRARGRNLYTAQVSGLGSAALSATTVTQAQCPVAMVSRVFFLGPQERYAFASNAHCQVVEACQRVKHSVTNQSSYTFRTDTLQNSCSSIYVCPLYRRQLACNEHFDYGGAIDYIRRCSFPAISTVQFTTGGADLYSAADESFFLHVQPYVHNSNVACSGRRAYPMHFGAKQNGKGPVQFLGGVNLSRSPNSQVTIEFAANLWAKASDETEVADVQLAAGTSTIMEVEFVVWNYKRVFFSLNSHIFACLYGCSWLVSNIKTNFCVCVCMSIYCELCEFLLHSVLCYRGGVGGYVLLLLAICIVQHLHGLCMCIAHLVACLHIACWVGIAGTSSPSPTTRCKEDPDQQSSVLNRHGLYSNIKILYQTTQAFTVPTFYLERWKVIPGHPNHQASTHGRIRGKHKVMKPHVDPIDGYSRLILGGKGVSWMSKRTLCAALFPTSPYGARPQTRTPVSIGSCFS